MLGLGLDAWNSLIAVFASVGAIFALLGGGATYVACRLQKAETQREKTAFEAYKLEANKSISEANARATEAQLALERYKAPREISDSDLGRLVAKLREFKGREYQITTFWDLKEPLALAGKLHQVLTLSEWDFIKPESGSFLLGGMSGIQVWSHPTASQKTKDAADALVAALNQIGLDGVRKFQAPNNPPDEKIVINVGTKPQ